MNYPTYTPLQDLTERIHRAARDKGFWEADRNFGEMLMLATSELAEALEEHRDGKPPVYVPTHVQGCAHSGDGLTEPDRTDCGRPECKPEGTAVELADCIIRCLDTMHSLGVNVDRVVRRKLAYNDTRPHMHGKAY